MDAQASGIIQQRTFTVLTWSGVLAVVVFHLLWLSVVVQPVNLTATRTQQRVSIPEVAFLGPPREGFSLAKEEDVRLVRSPVLFSLPTPIGFSGPLLSHADILEPPVLHMDTAPKILEMERPYQATAFGASSRALKELIKEPRPLFVPESPDQRVEPTMTGGSFLTNAFQVYWMDQPDQPLEIISGIGAESWAGNKNWEMLLYICFDDDGFIRQVMIEKPTAFTEINASVLRICRSIVFGQPRFGDCGRLVVHYMPSTLKVGDVP